MDAPAPDEVEQGSIIVVVATDAPLTPDQLKRIARRVSLGMGRLGSIHGNGSGDIFIAFSTANRGADAGNSDVDGSALPPANIQRLSSDTMDPLFTATAEATEEAIVNAMLAAGTMTGADYWRYYAIPHAELQSVLRKHGRLWSNADARKGAAAGPQSCRSTTMGSTRVARRAGA
jgi:L-aminopeptidase/D-esterase-like protein